MAQLRRKSLKAQNGDNGDDKLRNDYKVIAKSLFEKMKRLNTKKQIQLQEDLSKILKGTNNVKKARTTVNFH